MSTNTSAGVDFAYNIGVPNAGSEYGKARFVCSDVGVRDGFHSDAEVATMLANRNVSLFARRDGRLMRPGEIDEARAEDLFLAGIGMAQKSVMTHDLTDMARPVMPVLLGETDNQGTVDFVAAGALLAVVAYIRGRDPTEHIDEALAQARRLRSAAIESGAGNPPEDPAMILKASRPLLRQPAGQSSDAEATRLNEVADGVVFSMNHGMPNRLSRHGKAQFIGGDDGVADTVFTDDEVDAMLTTKEIHAYATPDGRLIKASSLTEGATTEAFFNGAVRVECAPEGGFDLDAEVAPLLAVFTGQPNTPGVVDFRLVGRFWALAFYAIDKDPITGDFDMSEIAGNLREAAIARETSGDLIDLSLLIEVPSPRRRP